MMSLDPSMTAAPFVAGGTDCTYTPGGPGIRAVAGDGRTPREAAERPDRAADPDPGDSEALSLSELCDQIVGTHHVSLRADLARLGALSRQVARQHGDSAPCLGTLNVVFQDLADRLETHLLKAEVMLFPAIRHLEAGRVADAPFGSHLQAPLKLLTEEHGAIHAALAGLRGVPHGGAPLEELPPSVRELLGGLAGLERGVREYLDREARVLFPRALARFGTVGV
ncbi:hypothetical protein DVJ83_16965 (plasmid) [Deinococcus wulumuqiensis]|uniref:Hemerythrin-like domain-containing protein n=1 Tax=Deinococcus wulumuqiensis TaxID=980427 RepID=A0A345IM95_9DEIO|nr:hemerythrin domain-containing protein [Deinococcus wulumuqiensis]AXH00818.1 hypothetical protein DVJ83_16965 [Deinococcus wulumuqiensis]